MTRLARAYAAGDAEGKAVVLREGLSLWGGFDLDTGRIIDQLHPDAGRCLTGVILVMPAGRGSSSSSAVLAEAVRRGTGPSGIVLGLADPILTVGAIVAASLYGIACPIVVCSIDGLTTGLRLRVTAHDDATAQVTIIEERER
jgi:predicted aconitase with swiveling domain